MKYGHWKDTAIRVEGEAVRELTKLFLVDFGINVRKMPDIRDDLYPKTEVKEHGYVVPFGDGPHPLYNRRVGKSVIQNMLGGATRYMCHITVKGFYDDVVELSAEDRAKLSRAPFDMEEYKEFLDIKEVKGEAGYTTLERTGIRPCLDVNGIWGGYTGEGAKTVLPSVAHAKISMRLVPNQDSATITRLFTEHFKAIAPDYVKVEVIPHHGGDGFLIPISSPAYKAAEKAMTEVYGIEPVPSRGGGSIPILADLQRILGIDPLLMGFGLERDTIHSPNESYLLKQLFAGMEAIALFYRYY